MMELWEKLLLWGFPPPAEGQRGSTFWAFFPFLLIILIIYFLMIRPQARRQRELQRMIASLQKGDRVVTVGGIYGTIVGIRDNSFILKIADNVKIEVARSSIARKIGSA